MAFKPCPRIPLSTLHVHVALKSIISSVHLVTMKKESAPEFPQKLALHFERCLFPIRSPSHDELHLDLPHPPKSPNEKGKAIFRQENIEVPEAFSDLAQNQDPGFESTFTATSVKRAPIRGRRPRVTPFKQVVDRGGKTNRALGAWADAYFSGPDQARVFEEDLTWLLVNQYEFAFEAPRSGSTSVFSNAYGSGKDSCKATSYWDQDQRPSSWGPRASMEYLPVLRLFHPARRGQHGVDHGTSPARRDHAFQVRFGLGARTCPDNPARTAKKLSGGGKPSGPLSFLATSTTPSAGRGQERRLSRAAPPKMNTLKTWHPGTSRNSSTRSRSKSARPGP